MEGTLAGASGSCNPSGNWSAWWSVSVFPSGDKRCFVPCVSSWGGPGKGLWHEAGYVALKQGAVARLPKHVLTVRVI